MTPPILPEEALAGLNEAQRYAVTLGGGPILVIAGAGTGKTRTLVHRVAHLVAKGVPAEALLLLTFTRRAAEEMLSRARALNPACGRVEGGTFHSMAHRLLRRYGHKLGLSPSFSIIDPADAQAIIRGAVEELGLRHKGDRRFPQPGTLRDIISKARNLELSLEDTIQAHAPQFLPYLDTVEAVARTFAEQKRAQELLDYDDLLYEAERLLKDDYPLRKELGARWRHFLVDEYQDTNAVQARLLELLATAHQNLMVVGDDAQSIYAFRGARLRNILDFPKRFPGTRVVKLEQNYRSTQPILDLTNRVIAQATERYEKNLFTDRGGGPRPLLLRPREQRGMSRLVVEKIRGLLAEGTRPEDIAVLFRSGRDSFDLEAELRAEGLAFVKYGGIRFVELAHVKDVMAHLRVLVNHRDHLSWQRVLLLLPQVGPKTGQQIAAPLITAATPVEARDRLAESPLAGRIPGLKDLAALLCQVAAMAKPLEMLQAVLAYYEPLCQQNYEDYPRRLKDLAELPALAEGAAGLADFLADTVLDPPAAEAGPAERHPLTLSTAHSAKGKEWPHVFVLWANEGRFPAFPSLDDPEALEEERRLFYVACTRAAQGLTLLAPREHFLEQAGWRPMEASRFLADLPDEVIERPAEGAVFPAEFTPSPAPVSRGSQRQDRPHPVGSRVSHPSFGRGKVMGYQGQDKIIVNFDRLGLKILLLRLANLQPA